MKFNKTLWTIQGLLAVLFLFAGVMKLVVPIDEMAAQVGLPGPFFRFIGVVETLGAIGLILPWLLRIRRALTPLAAAGLVIIMIGAAMVTAIAQGIAPALMPVVVGILAASVAFGRARELGAIGRKSAARQPFVVRQSDRSEAVVGTV